MERRPLAKTTAMVGGTILPPHVSIMGNRFTLVDGAGARHPLNTLSLDCVILDINEKMSRMYYGPDNAYDPDNTAAPLCFSDNGVAPSSRAREPQAKSCKPDSEGVHGCRWSVWGSATSKLDGKQIPACANGVKLALLMVTQQNKKWLPLISDKDGYKPMVFMLRVPPASLAGVANYGKTVSGMGKLTIPWTGEEVQSDLGYVVTRIEFEPQAVGKLQFRAVGYIEKEIDALIDVIPQERVDVAVGRDDEPILAIGFGRPEPGATAAVAAPKSQIAAQAPQPAPQAAPAEKRGRGRPRTNAAPAPAPAPQEAPLWPQPSPGGAGREARSLASTFEPRPNPNIVTVEDVQRDIAARMEQEGREAAIHAQGVQAVAAAVENEKPAPIAAPGNKFGIVESAPEPPQDALDSFFDLKM
jgi:hypothetical protein